MYATNARRPFDVLVYGATGYTGKLVAEYLSKLKQPGSLLNGSPLKVAVAGRNKEKLEHVASSCDMTNADIVVANTSDPDGLRDMVATSKLVISCVGPYSLHGPPVLEACIRENTHYVDISGEPQWIRRMSAQWSLPAKERGMLAVPALGFDSVPADMGVSYLLRHLESCQLPEGLPKCVGIDGPSEQFTLRNVLRGIHGVIRVNDASNAAFFNMSGGTWNTFIQSYADVAQTVRAKEQEKALKRGTPSKRRPGRHIIKPDWDETSKTYNIPFGGSDELVVGLTALRGERMDFTYRQFIGTESAVRAWRCAALFTSMMEAAKWSVTRSAMRQFRKHGQGPSESHREQSSIEFRFYPTFHADLPEDFPVPIGVFKAPEIYKFTAAIVAEGSVAMLKDLEENNGANLKSRSGVYTPSALMYDLLLDRLKGMDGVFVGTLD